MLVLLFIAAVWLAYANGANDNLKGVATLLGSRTCSYQRALVWGTVTTLAGSLCAVVLSGKLLAAFSGRGVVPPALVGDPTFLFAMGAGAAAVVMGATLMGLPVSTTHALVGGLAGAGVAASGLDAVSWSTLLAAFALPLLLSPLCSAALVALLYPLLHRARLRLGVDHDTSVEIPGPSIALASAPASLSRSALGRTGPREAPAVRVVRYQGTVLGVTAQTILDGAHYLSAGAVGFSRGLNDTPKIAALLLAAGLSSPAWSMATIGAGMAVGAILQAVRVGRTMGFEITTMNTGQGFTANLATSAMVFGASALGMPVSTTHVSVSALFGLGATNRSLVRATMRRILLAWVATLPVGFVLAAVVYFIASAA